MVFIDIIYLYLMADYSKNIIFSIQKSNVQPRILPIVILYIIMSFSLNHFSQSNYNAFLLGFTIYSAYELTNYSIFKKWKPILVFIDSIWGGILLMLTAISTKHIYKTLKI